MLAPPAAKPAPQTMAAHAEILCLATKGAGTNDEQRIQQLLAPLAPEVWPFDAQAKLRSALKLLRRLRTDPPALVVLEGTGLAGGLAVLIGRLLLGTPFVVSSGDAVAPFLAMRSRAIGPIAALYERMLYRMSSGFIGWSPY